MAGRRAVAGVGVHDNYLSDVAANNRTVFLYRLLKTALARLRLSPLAIARRSQAEAQPRGKKRLPVSRRLTAMKAAKPRMLRLFVQGLPADMKIGRADNYQIGH